MELSPFVPEWHAALRWAADAGNVRAGFRLAAALDPWWRENGGAEHGRELLSRLCDADLSPAELASASLLRAGLADDPDERTLLLERAVAAAGFRRRR